MLVHLSTAKKNAGHIATRMATSLVVSSKVAANLWELWLIKGEKKFTKVSSMNLAYFMDQVVTQMIRVTASVVNLKMV